MVKIRVIITGKREENLEGLAAKMMTFLETFPPIRSIAIIDEGYPGTNISADEECKTDAVIRVKEG